MCSFWPSHRSSLSCCLSGTKSSLTFAFSVFESVSLMLRSHLVFDQVKLATFNKFKFKRSYCLARLRRRKMLLNCSQHLIIQCYSHCSNAAPVVGRRYLTVAFHALSAKTFFVARSQLRFSSLALDGSKVL